MLDVGRPLLPDRAFLRLSRVRGAHQLAQVGDGIFLLERQHHDRAARHEVRQRIEEGPAGVHGIELLRLVLGDLQHLHGENAEVVFFELLDDVAHSVPANSVRLDDGEGTFQSLHVRSLILGF